MEAPPPYLVACKCLRLASSLLASVAYRLWKRWTWRWSRRSTMTATAARAAEAAPRRCLLLQSLRRRKMQKWMWTSKRR